MTFKDLEVGQGFYEAHSHHEFVKVTATEARAVPSRAIVTFHPEAEVEGKAMRGIVKWSI